jgi:hypothetical protein
VDLFSELKVLWKIIPEGTDTALKALQYIKSSDGSFLNTKITYRIMLTVPIMVASAE